MVIVEEYDSLFLLDFVGRYAVDRCGANSGVDTAIMSVLCMLPIFGWVLLQIAIFFRNEIYFQIHKCTLTLLTLIQVLMLVVYNHCPPVIGCGPSKSFPCTQVALCAYLTVSVASYERDFGFEEIETVSCIRKVMILNAMVSYSVLCIGFADFPACVAGSIVGSVVACTVHALIVLTTNEKPVLFGQLIHFIEFITNKPLHNDMIICTMHPSTNQESYKTTEHETLCMGFAQDVKPTGVF